MDPDYQALAASDGNGESVRATVQSGGRSIGSSTIPVNSTTNWPTGTFIATTGTLLSNGALDPTTAQVFYGTASGTDITITSFAAGYTDKGNSPGDVVVIKPTTEWANLVQDAVNAMVPAGVVMPFGGSSAPTGWLLCHGQAVSRSTYATLYGIVSTTYGSGDGSTTFNLPDLRGRVPLGAGAYTWLETFAAAAVNTGTSQITVTASPEWITGHSVVLTGTGTAPTGLSFSNTYYVIVINSTTIQLASSLANAVAGTAISLTGAGTGVNTLTHTGSSTHPAGEIGGEDNHTLLTAEIPAHSHVANNNVSGSGSLTWNGVSGGGSNVVTGQTGGSGSHNNLQPYTSLNYIIKT